MLRRVFIRKKDALSPVLSLILALAIVMPAIGTIFMYGIPAINDLNEKKETEKGKNVLGSVSDEVMGLTNSGFNDSTTVNFDLTAGSSISMDQGTDRTVLMYSTDPGYSFNVSNFENQDSFFYLYYTGVIPITQLKAKYYLIDPTKETCFLAGTKVLMADESYKNIEDVRVGDSVKSYDEKSGKLTDGVVTHVFSHAPDEMGEYYLVINNQLCVTPNHRFYSDGKWVYADNLKKGDSLYSYNLNNYVVSSILKVYSKVTTYDIEVVDCHTYFVSIADDVDVLVHNPLRSDFLAAADAFVNKSNLNFNYGSYQYVSVNSNSSYCHRTFIKFDVSSIPAGSTIVSAILKLYTYPPASGNPIGRIYDCHRVLATWAEASITFNNQPTYFAAPTFSSNTIAPPGWMTWDVKSNVQDFVNGVLQNYGWIIKDRSETSPGTTGLNFRSRDYSLNQPVLEVDYTLPNSPPDIPLTPVGPSIGLVGTSYDYSTQTTDPENNQIYYWFDWGDGTNSGWLGPKVSGEKITASHSWGSPNTYYVKVQAKDTNGALSGWSNPLAVDIHINHLPTNPTVTGLNHCHYGTSYDWTLLSTDPDGDQVSYYVDWGDGTNSGWLGPYASGTAIDYSHTYNSVGAKTIQAKARDVPYYAESGPTSYPINVYPATATVTGPTIGLVGAPYTFTVTSAGSTEFRFNFEGTWTSWNPSNQATYAWTTTGVKTITGQGCAGSGWESDTGSTTISIDQPPIVDIAHPADDDQTVYDMYTISGAASDSDGSVDHVEVMIDSLGWELASGKTSWSKSWDTAGVVNGQHTISARSIDDVGVPSNIVSRNVNVYNEANPRQKENKKIYDYAWACSISGPDSNNVYTITFCGKTIHGTGVIDLYDTVSGIDHYFGSIWFFDSNSITYEPSGDKLSSLIIENGIIIDNNGNSLVIENIPNIIDKNGVLSLSICQLVKSPNSGWISISGNRCRLNLKSCGSGMSVRDRFNKVYDFKMQFYGDNSDAWRNYLINPNNYLNFELINSNGVKSIEYTPGSVNLVLWHTYIEFGINI